METEPQEEARPAVASAEAKSELQDYLEISQQRHKLFPRAAAVGLAAGGVAVLLAGAASLFLAAPAQAAVWSSSDKWATWSNGGYTGALAGDSHEPVPPRRRASDRHHGL